MKSIILAILLICNGVIVASQELHYSDVPDWVDVSDLPVMKDALYRYVEDGRNFLLVDRQVRWIGDEQEYYYRIATEILNRTGLEEIAAISRDFDPNIETLTLVQLDVRRNGETLPLRDQVTANLFRRESRLESGIIDGTLTAHIDVPGVRVGDIVDVAFVWRSQEYLPGMNFSGSYSMEYSTPVALARTIVHWPNDREMSLAEVPGFLQSTVVPGKDTTRYEWRVADRIPLYVSNDVPSEYRPWAAINLSSFKTWGSVSDTLNQHYTSSPKVPPSWAAKVDQIAADYETPEGRAFAALQLVQDEIRYVGLEVGAGGYIARSPAQVVANEFGDCKDKSMLLKTILNSLGIEAQVALANLETGYGLKDQLPGLNAFDHMIVGANLDGETFWMDPTATYERGGLNGAIQPDYGYVLPLTNGPDDLVLIDPNRHPQFYQDITETFSFSFVGAMLRVETIYRGQNANWERAYWAANSKNAIFKGFLEYYAQFYPGIERLKDPVLEDQAQANKVIVSESYLIPRLALHKPDLFQNFPFVSAQRFSGIPKTVNKERTGPLALLHRARYKHTVEVRNAPINFLAPDTVKTSSAGFDHFFSARDWDGGNLDLHWNYESKSRTVAPRGLADVIEQANTARELRSFTWDLRSDDQKEDAPSFIDRMVDRYGDGAKKTD